MAFQSGGDVNKKGFQSGGEVDARERLNFSEGFPPDTYTQIKNVENATSLLPPEAKSSMS